ncbi:MAG: hypothetical protein FWG23_05890 [Eggerthellaceae bacterium]|jgi:hypothetical protein|nr:hypothetical protein [Eggerthellaceae bacterium]MDR2715671.1 hypothetical protein [Coriobacteriaceae bacterium]
MKNRDDAAVGAKGPDASDGACAPVPGEDGAIEATARDAQDDFISIGGDFAERVDPASRLEDMAFEERVAYLTRVVMSNPMQREILYKTLKYCSSRRVLSDVEESIAAYPEFAGATQSPYYLLLFLVNGGGIDAFDLDAEGEVVTAERKEGLGIDEIDDLVAQYAYETNEVGKYLIEEMSPKNRLVELLDIVPEYYDTYIEVLGFLEEKQSFADVDRLLRGREVLTANRNAGDRPIQPSVFIDKLEKAGGIYWEEGWRITPEGKELLEALEGGLGA